MELSVHDFVTGSEKSKIDVSDAVFGIEYNEALVHQVVNAYLLKARSGNAVQKNRASVSGGGIKPWRQKGTGRARSGTSRSPIWRSGGVTFASEKRDYSQKVNKKMYRKAIRSILSELSRQDRLHIVENIELNSHKTGELNKIFSSTKLDDKVLVIDNEINQNFDLACRNIPYADCSDVKTMDPVRLVACNKMVMTESALKGIEEWLQ